MMTFALSSSTPCDFKKSVMHAASGLDGAFVSRGKQKRHVFALTVQYEDVDAGGIVYHATYLNYAERARSAWLRLCKFDVQDWLITHHQGFVITQAEIEYHSPAQLHAQLYVETSCLRLGGASATLRQEIKRIDTDLHLATIVIKAAWVDTHAGPRKLPELLHALIASFHADR